MRKFIAGFLCIAFICSLLGCSSGNKDTYDVAKGRYMERPLKLPGLAEDGIIDDIAYDSEGKLHVLAEEGKYSECRVYSYVEKDGNFEKKEITAYADLIKQGYIIFNSCFGEDDKWYVLLERTSYLDKDGKEYIDDDIAGPNRTYTADEYNRIEEATKDMTEYVQDKLFREEEDITPASFIKAEYDTSGLNANAHDLIDSFQANKDGIVVWFNLPQSKLVRYDSTTKEEKDIVKSGDDPTWCLKGKSIYLAKGNSDSGGTKGKVEVYDIDSLKSDKIDMEIAVGGDTDSVISVDDNGSIYIINKNGVYKHQKNGTLWEELFQNEQFSIGSTTQRILAMLINANDEISVMTVNDDRREYSLFQYYYDPDVVSKPTKTITIYSLWESESIREAARKYQLAHPDIAVEFTVPDQTNTDKTDMVQKLNTEILAGKGADIIVTDGLNQTSYEKKGVLEELSSVIDSSKLADFITSNYVHDGKLYGVPVKITIPIVESTADMSKALGSMESLAQYSKDATKPVFMEEQETPLLQKLLFAYGNEIFTEDGTIDSAKLTSFLEQTKTIMDKSDLEKKFDTGSIYKESCQADVVYSISFAPCLYAVNDIIEGQACFYNNASVKNICECETAKEKEGCFYSTLNNTFMSSGTVTVNSNSANKEDAKEFIKYLFSDEIQQMDCRDGYPVTKSALENWRTDYKARLGMIVGAEPGGKDIYYMVDPPDETTRKLAIDMVEQLKAPIYQDSQIISMITEESESYFKGSADLKATVDTIIQKVDRYLEEQK